MRDTILAEIKRIAEANGGTPPGAGLFRTETGIGENKWRGVYWARWGDALIEAGYSANEWKIKLDSAQLLERVAAIVVEKGALPTSSELDLMRRTDPSIPNPKTLRHHFDGRSGLIVALRTFCAEREGFKNALAFLPDEPDTRQKQPAQPLEGWVYLLKSGQHYKIGRSDQLEQRVKKITVAMPEATTLVHSIRTDDPPGIEAYWHRRFDDCRANGEWFKLSAADVAAFMRRKFQ